MSRNPWLIGITAGLIILACVCSLLFAGVAAYLLLGPSGDLTQILGLADTAVPAAIDRIVIVDANGQIATLDATGQGRRNLTQGGTAYQFPAWAPDGKRIAAVGANSREAGVFVMPDVAASKPLALYQSAEQSPFYLYWSPDSSAVSFLANEPAGIALWLADARGQEPAKRLLPGQPFYWQWGLDSDELFIHTGAAGPDASLGFIDRSGQAIENNVARPGSFQSPGISPSGQYLAFAEIDDQGMNRVAVVSRTGDEDWRIPYTGGVALSWSPTADRLAYIHPPQNAPHFYGPIHVLDTATGAQRTLTTRTAVAFFWSPDGQSIAYFSPARADDSPGARRSSGLQAQPSPTSLDLWLLNPDTGDERRLVNFQPGFLFTAQFLPFFDQYALSHRLWSPHSDSLLIPMRDEDGIERVYIIPTDGSERRAIAEGSAAFWSWQ